MKKQENSCFMPKNMFSNFRYHLIVPFVKICDIHASIPAIIRKYWSSSTLLKPIICYGSMVLKQLHLIRAMSVQTECRATRAGSKELRWGEAWLRRRQCQCNPNAERRELALKSYAEVQPDLAKQRYNLNTPKSKFFRHLISHPYFFKQLYKAPNPFIYKHFRTFFKRKKKIK